MFKKILVACLLTTSCHLSATVLVTNGMGTGAIQFYKDSAYIQALATSAQAIDHAVKGIAWLSPNDPNKEYAGLHPQERIAGAAIIAKAIIDELADGQEVILVGHSFGGHVMQCATRLLNPANKEITDTFVYELVYSIKELLGDQKRDIYTCSIAARAGEGSQTKSLSPKTIINGLIAGWHISKVVIAAIEKAHIVNQHLIDYVKEHVSLTYLEEIKKTWAKSFDTVQKYKNRRKVKHTGAVTTLYTIGTPFNGSNIFTADMAVVNHHVNLYSVDDTIPEMVGTPRAPATPRTTNLRVYFEPEKSYAPDHHQFCGNLLMAPWILLVPSKLQEQHAGNFDHFVWGTGGMITFFTKQAPVYQAD